MKISEELRVNYTEMCIRILMERKLKSNIKVQY